MFRNSDKIGAALSRGTEKNIIAPLSNYLDNLWKNIPGATEVSNATKNIDPTKIFDPLPGAYGATTQPTPQHRYFPQPVPNVSNNPGLPPSFSNPPASNLPFTSPRGTGSYAGPGPAPYVAPATPQSKAGYYYK